MVLETATEQYISTCPSGLHMMQMQELMRQRDTIFIKPQLTRLQPLAESFDTRGVGVVFPTRGALLGCCCLQRLRSSFVKDSHQRPNKDERQNNSIRIIQHGNDKEIRTFDRSCFRRMNIIVAGVKEVA